jgi:hypothetical protein
MAHNNKKPYSFQDLFFDFYGYGYSSKQEMKHLCHKWVLLSYKLFTSLYYLETHIYQTWRHMPPTAVFVY